MNIVKTLFLTVLLLIAPLSQQAAAVQEQAQQIDRSQAATKAQQHEKGRVLRVEQTRTKYRVKVLKKNGRVVSVDVDKKTGKVQPATDKDN